jgi:hypothetical protein
MKIKAILLSMVMLCTLAMATDYFQLTVYVEKPAGTRQEGAYVTVERSGYETRSGYTGKGGFIIFPDLEVGTWWVNASKYIGGMMWYDDEYVTGYKDQWKYVTLVLHEPSK